MKGEFGRKTLAKLRPDCPGPAKHHRVGRCRMTLALEAVPSQGKQALPVSVGSSSTRSINPERQLVPDIVAQWEHGQDTPGWLRFWPDYEYPE